MLNKSQKTRPINKQNLKDYENFLRFQQLVKTYAAGENKEAAPMFYGLNATPLGLCGFALTTFIVSMYLAGVAVPVDASMGVVMGTAFFYGGVIQVIGGYLEYREGNNFGALTFCSYGGFWLGFSSLDVAAFDFLAGYKDASVIDNAMGVFFLAWTIFTACMLLAALRTNLATIALFFILLIAFILLSISKFLQSQQNLQRAGGAFGILTAAIAWYIAFAQLLNKSDWFFKLPLFEMPKGKPKKTKKSLESP